MSDDPKTDPKTDPTNDAAEDKPKGRAPKPGTFVLVRCYPADAEAHLEELVAAGLKAAEGAPLAGRPTEDQVGKTAGELCRAARSGLELAPALVLRAHTPESLDLEIHTLAGVQVKTSVQKGSAVGEWSAR